MQQHRTHVNRNANRLVNMLTKIVGYRDTKNPFICLEKGHNYATIDSECTELKPALKKKLR
jgi:hypothetical protein